MSVQSENERQYQVIDQMLTMHSAMRDKYGRRALLLNCTLLGVSVVLNALVFADEDMSTLLGLKPTSAKFALGMASAMAFLIALIELRVDWSGISRLHDQAAEQLANLKAKYREEYSKGTVGSSGVLSGEYSRVTTSLPAIPESEFFRLKKYHLTKRLISAKMSSNPGAPIILIRFQVWYEGIAKVFQRN